MVNDQLIRLHQLRQLWCLENMNSKENGESIGTEPFQTQHTENDVNNVAYEQLELQHERQHQERTSQSDSISEFSNSNRQHLNNQLRQQHPPIMSDSLDSIARAAKSEVKRSLTPKKNNKHSTDNSVSNSTNASPIREKSNLKKQSSSSSGNSSNASSNQSGVKRRSTWRNLLSPSYKSRSDEFHKIFCDKIPKNERLIADYACALHREILIQGRVYISINYVAFYSNLFSWITKLVIRLRDISEIYKANTARIIPNAIQIIMTNGDKHVFASFVARDKSYVMLLRIWQNNLMSERMTDQEIRNLVHFSYGKDLGMSDSEELKINSPDPVTPANIPLEAVQPVGNQPQPTLADGQQDDEVDRNNNPQSSSQKLIDSEQPTSTTRIEECATSRIHRRQEIETCHTRYNSFDLNTRSQRTNQNDVIAEVVSKLNELSSSYKQQVILENETNASSANSSTVMIDTPPELIRSEDTVMIEERDHLDMNDGYRHENLVNEADPSDNNRHSLGVSSTETKLPANRSGDEYDDEVSTTRRVDGEELIELTTHCECKEHQGHFIKDQEFDINVDTLFTLMFTNSKFMRTYMIRRGITDMIMGSWKRSNSSSDRSSGSSTLSYSGGREGVDAHLVRIKQARQLNYSMNIKHIWAKQVRVEERQSICQVKSGVYVLQSQTINSGIPYGETFTVDLTYCLTRNGDINKSRMLVHSLINFNKEKQNWKLAMVKSMIERQCLQGVNEFVGDLVYCIKEYIDKTLKRAKKGEGDEVKSETTNEGEKSSADKLTGKFYHSAKAKRRDSVSHGIGQHGGRYQFRHGSLVRAKSKLKEKKLRNMYRCYIDNSDCDDLERGSAATTHGRQFENDDDHSENYPDSDSSLLSFSDIGDNGSMIMMTHANDDQISDAGSDIILENRAGGIGSADRSFSDVDSGKQNSKTARKCSDKGNWRTSLLTKLRSKRNKNPGKQSISMKASGREVNHGQHSSYPITIRNLRLGSIDMKSLTGFLIVTLLFMVLAMIASHVIILRRLDSLEARLRVKCGDSLSMENENQLNSSM